MDDLGVPLFLENTQGCLPPTRDLDRPPANPQAHHDFAHLANSLDFGYQSLKRENFLHEVLVKSLR